MIENIFYTSTLVWTLIMTLVWFSSALDLVFKRSSRDTIVGWWVTSATIMLISGSLHIWG